MIKTLALAGTAAALVLGSMAVTQTTSQNPNAPPSTGMNAQSTAPNAGTTGYNAPSATDTGANASATAPDSTATTGERG